MRVPGLILCLSLSCGSDQAGTSDTETTGTSGGDVSSSSGDATPTDVTATVTDTDTGTGTSAPSTGEPETGSTSGTDTDETSGSTAAPVTGSESGSSGEDTSTGAPSPGDATVENACAPNDGPALEFRLELAEASCGAAWSQEALRVVLYTGGPLAPGLYPLGDELGFASRQGAGDPAPVFAMTGSVTIEAWNDAAVVGTYDLVFADATVRSGEFSGPFCPTMPMCG